MPSATVPASPSVMPPATPAAIVRDPGVVGTTVMVDPPPETVAVVAPVTPSIAASTTAATAALSVVRIPERSAITFVVTPFSVTAKVRVSLALSVVSAVSVITSASTLA